ncbi:hypothetical protein BSQ39_04165 [Loigolactobacillus backii]|nr:hypothetical protein BSQ39_04165 [Loigolactobacillus backii]
MEIGERLKSARRAKQLSQQTVANQIYVSRQTISSWETGRSYPDISSLIALSDIYELSLDQLLKEDVKMMDNVKVKERELKQARYVYWASLIVDLLLVAILVLGLYLKELAVSTTVLGLLLAIIIFNGFVLISSTNRYRKLQGKPLATTKREWNRLTVGVIIVVVIVNGVAIWRQGLTSFTSGLMVGSILCGVLILKWIHNDVDRHKK